MIAMVKNNFIKLEKEVNRRIIGSLEIAKISLNIESEKNNGKSEQVIDQDESIAKNKITILVKGQTIDLTQRFDTYGLAADSMAQAITLVYSSRIREALEIISILPILCQGQVDNVIYESYKTLLFYFFEGCENNNNIDFIDDFRHIIFQRSNTPQSGHESDYESEYAYKIIKTYLLLAKKNRDNKVLFSRMIRGATYYSEKLSSAVSLRDIEILYTEQKPLNIFLVIINKKLADLRKATSSIIYYHSLINVGIKDVLTETDALSQGYTLGGDFIKDRLINLTEDSDRRILDKFILLLKFSLKSSQDFPAIDVSPLLNKALELIGLVSSKANILSPFQCWDSYNGKIYEYEEFLRVEINMKEEMIKYISECFIQIALINDVETPLNYFEHAFSCIAKLPNRFSCYCGQHSGLRLKGIKCSLCGTENIDNGIVNGSFKSIYDRLIRSNSAIQIQLSEITVNKLITKYHTGYASLLILEILERSLKEKYWLTPIIDKRFGKVIRFEKRLKRLIDIEAPEVMLSIEKRFLKEAKNSLELERGLFVELENVYRTLDFEQLIDIAKKKSRNLYLIIENLFLDDPQTCLLIPNLIDILGNLIQYYNLNERNSELELCYRDFMNMNKSLGFKYGGNFAFKLMEINHMDKSAKVINLLRSPEELNKFFQLFCERYTFQEVINFSKLLNQELIDLYLLPSLKNNYQDIIATENKLYPYLCNFSNSTQNLNHFLISQAQQIIQTKKESNQTIILSELFDF
ncbi:hypothetical protein N8301_05745 [Cyclobacteriaceae bacterium]|nr:hypothetical protein [Cyclobacteriaceae bacterium]